MVILIKFFSANLMLKGVPFSLSEKCVRDRNTFGLAMTTMNAPPHSACRLPKKAKDFTKLFWMHSQELKVCSIQ